MTESRFRSSLRALHHRNFRLFYMGQTISLIGTWMQQVAQAWLVYRITGSATLLGVVGFASQIRIFLLSPVGGIVSDTDPSRAGVIAGDRGSRNCEFPGSWNLQAR